MSKHAFEAIDLEALDEVVGGGRATGSHDPSQDGYGVSAGLNVGPFSAGITVTDKGATANFGVGASWGVGGYVDAVTVSPNHGQTVQDVLNGTSYGIEGHYGVGGQFSANSSGSVLGVGVGAGVGGSLGLGASYGIGPDPHGAAPSGTPNYDAMGNFTGTYDPPAQEAPAHDPSLDGMADHMQSEHDTSPAESSSADDGGGFGGDSGGMGGDSGGDGGDGGGGDD